MGFPGGSDGKESCKAGDLGSIPGSGGSPGEGNGYPLQYFCLENLEDRGAWWATVHSVIKSGNYGATKHALGHNDGGSEEVHEGHSGVNLKSQR